MCLRDQTFSDEEISNLPRTAHDDYVNNVNRQFIGKRDVTQ